MKTPNPQTLILFYILFLIAITSLSCNKGGNPFAVKSEDAVVVDRGSIAADGCGWQIITTPGDSTYYPENLSAQFQVNNLKVHITYHKLKPRYSCSQIANDPGPGITEIQLDGIVAR